MVRGIAALVAVATALGASLLPGSARGQTTSACSGITLEVRSRENYSSTHGVENEINAADCAADEEWDISYTIGVDTRDMNLIFYVGSSCNVEENRADSDRCRHLERDMNSPDATDRIILTATEIVGSDCEGRDTAHVWFLLFDSSGSTDADIAACGTLEFPYDMTLPPAPTNLDAAGGDEGVSLSWEHGSSTSEDHARYVIYCYPPAGGSTVDGDADVDADSDSDADQDQDADLDQDADVDEAGSDADVDGDADADAGEGDGDGYGFPAPIPKDGETDCPEAAYLPEGSSYEDLEGYVCQRVDELTTSYRVSGLENGTSYAFSVAAVDQADNVGPSSAPICATPVPVDDFFAMYRDAGGGPGSASSQPPFTATRVTPT